MQAVDTSTRITVRNILFTTDFSAQSQAAFGYAVELARRYGAKLEVLHVVPAEVGAVVPTPMYMATLEEQRAAATKKLQKYDVALTGVVPHRVRFTEGDVAPSILSAIQEDEIDLV